MNVLLVVNTSESISDRVSNLLDDLLINIKTDIVVLLLTDSVRTENKDSNISTLQKAISDRKKPFMYLTSSRFLRVEDRVRDVVIITDKYSNNRAIYYELIGRGVNPNRIRFWFVDRPSPEEEALDVIPE